MNIEKYSFGTGDRFGMEGEAQLAAVVEMNRLGVPVVPVWNKSYREHKIVRTDHSSVKKEADRAVNAVGWGKSYYTDADHIGLDIVDEFIDYSNFFTIDVAGYISRPVSGQTREDFINRYSSYTGKLKIPGLKGYFEVTKPYLASVADKYLTAIREVGKIYNYIRSKKGEGNFVPEVSMDETEDAQTPLDLFFILAELKREGVEVQTIAPKFTGLFAKGIDYIGDRDLFAKEFEQDVAVVRYAVEHLELPRNLKISVHSGSDKFSLYPVINAIVEKYNAGIHVKTAGTTWLEEVNGLAEAGGEGLAIAKKIYIHSLNRFEELTAPYESVLSINKKNLPGESVVNAWGSREYVAALQHDQQCSDYNPDLRQLIHVGYKVAVEMGSEFTDALREYRSIISERVTYNLLERHLKKLFPV
jgi:hypothetical protein